MKKKLAFFLCFILLITSNILCYAEETAIMTAKEENTEEKGPIAIRYNGDLVESSAAPEIIDGRCMVPFRVVFETFDMMVEYDPITHMITGKNEEMELNLIAGSSLCVINDISFDMGVAAVLKGDITYVPLRFIGEALNAEVIWAEEQNTVYLIKPEEYVPEFPNVPETQDPGEIDPNHPTVSQYEINEMILGEPEVSMENAILWAKSKKADERFLQAAEYYWQYGKLTEIRPEVLYCQAAKETGFGRYGGNVIPEQNNFAGIKTADATGDTTFDHETFASMEDGVRGHFNHMSAYVGLDPIGEPHARYYNVKSISWAGSVRTITELGQRWAPASDYGISIINDYLKPLLDFQNK